MGILSTPPEEHYHEPARDVSWTAFMDIVESRRSVRVFDSTPIPDEVVRKCLCASLLTASSSNLQPWEFYWVKSPAAKEALVKACLSHPPAATAQTLIVCVARTHTWRKTRDHILETFHRASREDVHGVSRSTFDYYEKIVPFVYNQGPLGIFSPFKKLLYFALGFFRPVPRAPASPNDMKVWAVKSTALAAQTLMLAFRASGFDSCPMEGLDSTRVKKLLNLPRDATVVMVLGAGKRAPNGVYGPRLRCDDKQFIHEI